ncbi:MAG: DUF3365 domain-containing protein [Nitrospirales bacterium]|nr:DUF3365 domain-containing protein [Nitrospirales bacterium]
MTRVKEKWFFAFFMLLLILVFHVGSPAVSITADRAQQGISPKVVADFLQAIIDSHRTVYATRVVERLKNQGIVLASEDWEARHNLPLPAQFLMQSARLVAERKEGIRYRLTSLWPIYRRNAPATPFEKKGLEAVLKDPDKPYTGVVKSGKRQFFQAIYADRAVSEACVVCHNTHPMSPKRDFKLKDVMGGLVITIPLS